MIAISLRSHEGKRTMFAARREVLDLYVDRSSQQWVVRDSEGNFWIVPSMEDAWGHRQPFAVTEESELEPVPGHYKYLLDLPF